MLVLGGLGLVANRSTSRVSMVVIAARELLSLSITSPGPQRLQVEAHSPICNGLEGVNLHFINDLMPFKAARDPPAQERSSLPAAHA